MPGVGGGSIEAMLTTLRNNAKLLRKRAFFLREDALELSRAEHKESLHFPEASEELLAKIKQKHSERKRRIDLLAFGVVTISLIAVLIFVQQNQNAAIKTLNHQKAVQAIVLNEENIENQRLYILHINAGDSWYSQSHFANAVFQYKLALKLYPNSKDVQQRLNNSYTLACRRYGLFCDEYDMIPKMK